MSGSGKCICPNSNIDRPLQAISLAHTLFAFRIQPNLKHECWGENVGVEFGSIKHESQSIQLQSETSNPRYIPTQEILK